MRGEGRRGEIAGEIGRGMMIVLRSVGGGRGGRGGGGMREVVVRGGRGGGMDTDEGMMEVGGGKRGRVGGRGMEVREGEVVEGERIKREQMCKRSSRHDD